ncbi:uncharacterized protein ACNLHF_027769 [Anomaloglossus baeobatrachus]|uniref:uncharacterized protein LOC142250181 isoform X2 n=1 Tax=Anomaloglossus baeobatrachus TaxID=238106 RepID=UPI003F4FE483
MMSICLLLVSNFLPAIVISVPIRKNDSGLDTILLANPVESTNLENDINFKTIVIIALASKAVILLLVIVTIVLLLIIRHRKSMKDNSSYGEDSERIGNINANCRIKIKHQDQDDHGDIIKGNKTGLPDSLHTCPDQQNSPADTNFRIKIEHQDQDDHGDIIKGNKTCLPDSLHTCPDQQNSPADKTTEKQKTFCKKEKACVVEMETSL